MAVPMLAALHRKGVGTKLAPSRGGQKCSQTFSPSPAPTSARDFFFLTGFQACLSRIRERIPHLFHYISPPPVSALSYSPKCAIKRTPHLFITKSSPHFLCAHLVVLEVILRIKRN